MHAYRTRIQLRMRALGGGNAGKLHVQHTKSLTFAPPPPRYASLSSRRRRGGGRFYKKFRIADMDRIRAPVDQDSISLAHSNNTLVITYAKPPYILEIEARLSVSFAC